VTRWLGRCMLRTPLSGIEIVSKTKPIRAHLTAALCVAVYAAAGFAQQSQPVARPAARDAKPGQTQAQPQAIVPQLVDITASTGIHFNHLASPEKKYIVESMSGGVALIDYDRDGWPDIYFARCGYAVSRQEGPKRAFP